MSFQLGDKVSFLNEALDGIVSKIIDNKMVEVTTKDGFGIPVLITELVKIGGNSEFLPKEEILSQNKKENTLQLQIKSNLENKPYLCFVRNSLNDKELYILNNTGYSQFFVLRIQKAGEWVLIYSGKVSKRSYVFVGAYLDKELDGFRKVIVDTISVDFSLKMHFAPKSIEVKIKTAKFFKDSSYTEIPILEKDAILIDVSGETIKEVEMHQEIKKPVEFLTKKKVLKSPKVVGKIELKQEKRNRSRGELDLHIENLGVPFKGKSNGQIVQIQLDAARDFIDKCILSGKRELILVHGVGNGTLKKEVHKLLKSYYGIRFEQGDARKYGEGATLVHLKG
tara:strand:- start:2551 stop:3564 length:1014 start_codon:yes stop_codon:yes gene_type:complete